MMGRTGNECDDNVLIEKSMDNDYVSTHSMRSLPFPEKCERSDMQMKGNWYHANRLSASNQTRTEDPNAHPCLCVFIVAIRASGRSLHH
jgi:hypothetical protein